MDPVKQLAQEVAEMRRKAAIKEMVEMNVKLVGTMYERAAAYTNLIIVAGYAGFFGLWSLTRPYLTSAIALIAALLIGLSLTVFIGFEIYKMVNAASAAIRRGKAFAAENDGTPETFVKLLREQEGANLRSEMRMARVWPWSLGATLVFGVGGSAMLIAALVCGILREYRIL